MSLSKVSNHGGTELNQELQRKASDEIPTSHGHHLQYQSCWHCPDCGFIDVLQNIRHHFTLCQPIGRLCCCLITYIIIVMFVPGIIAAVIIVSIVFGSSYHTDLSYIDTSYHFYETRLFEVSGFFKEQVEVSASDHFNANATLYIMKHSPPLSVKYSLSSSSTVEHGTFSSHYYLHHNSNVTLQACVYSNCDPYGVYIIKSPQNYANWLSKDVAIEKYVFVKNSCYDHDQQSNQINYTVTEDDHYYFAYHSNGYCRDNSSAKFKKDAGILSLYINKFEYSISKLQYDRACNTYEHYSCSVNLLLQAGMVKALITVQGYSGYTYDISFSSTMRKWPIPFIVSSCIIFLVCTKVIITCWLCHRKKKRNQRQYMSIQ